MKIAVFGDVHGNLPALQAVLDDIATQAADVTVCLGIPCVHGNTDL